MTWVQTTGVVALVAIYILGVVMVWTWLIYNDPSWFQVFPLFVVVVAAYPLWIPCIPLCIAFGRIVRFTFTPFIVWWKAELIKMDDRQEERKALKRETEYAVEKARRQAEEELTRMTNT